VRSRIAIWRELSVGKLALSHKGSVRMAFPCRTGGEPEVRLQEDDRIDCLITVDNHGMLGP